MGEGIYTKSKIEPTYQINIKAEFGFRTRKDVVPSVLVLGFWIPSDCGQDGEIRSKNENKVTMKY